MFPPAPEAKAFMDIDGKGFIVNGQRTFLASGSIHYPRVPRDLWHDRLLRLRRAGFNTVQTYTFWNYHEPVENQFEFTGEKDFEAYLKTAQDLDLYATVRVGPYVCAEWDSGGYPVWAKFKPDVVVRKESPGYMALQDHWLGEILPKVAAHQINKGGNVILVQLENEGQWWGAWKGPASNPYWEDLHQQAIKGGLEVPYFMSGFHHGSTPVPENPDNTGRQCPWYSTEIWAGWYSNYGPSDYEYMRTERCNEKILARGGNGYNYYMFHGGTNFDSWNDNENAATYDYGAALGEAGDPRPIYYREKANNLFATSFADILENSSVATAEYQDFATHARVIGARKSPAGTIVFVQGHVANDDPAVIQSIGAGTGGSLHLFPLEVTPIVLNAPIIPAPANIKIVQATSAILGLAHNGETTTLILYGQPGDTGVLTLALGEQIKKFNVAYPTTMPVEIVERLGGQSLRILAMSRQLADRTWIVGHPKREYVVVGPEFVGDFSMESGKAAMTIERPYLHPAPNKVVVFGGVNEAPQHLEVKADPSTDAAPAPALSEWQESIPPESNPDFNDASWKASDDPLQMGADDDISAFAWYRATVQAPQAGSGTLHFPGAADHLIVFINGRRCAATPSVVEPKPTSLELKDGKLSWTVQTDFQAGRNAIAVLATHQGRDKAGGYYGPIDHYFSKGIFEPVDLEMAGQNIPVKGWKMHGGLPAPSTLGFGPVTASETPAFFASTFNAPRPGIGPNPILRVKTTGLSRGTIFLNGHCIGRYPATVKVKDEPVPMYLPECWFAADAKNHLAVFDEEGKSPAQVQLVVETEASREVIAVSKPTDAATPIDLPPYHPVRLGDFITPAMEKPISASSSAPDHEPENANDADGETYWTPATEPTPDHPEWLMIDLQKTCHLLSCEIFWRNPVSLYPHLIEGSQDGKTWITLDDRRQNDTRQEDRTDAPFTHPADVRYLRLTVTKVVDPKKPLRILEVRAWEVPHN
jgi:beta-galactosidase